LDLSPAFFFIQQQLSQLLLSPGSSFSLVSLACALFISVLALGFRRFKRNGNIPLKVMMRALFPRRLLASRSNLVDLGYLGFYVLVYGVLIGWAVLSFQFLSDTIIDLLVAVFGPVKPSSLPELVPRSVITVMLFLAYELGYWINHYLSHRVPFMWEFHKVHHSATVLTPVTTFRVHPGYMLIFSNILAVTAAIGNGLGHYLFGETTAPYALSGTNVILVLFMYTYVHLQHSHVWIPLRGVLGRLIMSPAHHQIHHSSDPIHFNKNLGSCLAVWDWLFGTLYVPGKARERLSFGVEPDRQEAHTLRGEFFIPFRRAAACLLPKKLLARLWGGAPAPAAAEPAPARLAVRRPFEALQQ
jgi:sterol desaturase/sphingolipid hydroxylase (fatty acid hydroxylase superfamily)